MTLKLDDLQAPPAQPEFRPELTRRIETSERLARGRRRAAALVAVAAALVIASAASVSAFRQQITRAIDVTYVCSVPQIGGVYRVDVHASVRGIPIHYGTVRLPNRAQASFDASAPSTPGGTMQLVGLDEFRNGYGSDDQLCSRSHTPIRMSPAALRPAGVVTGSKGATIQEECWLAPTVTVRMHIVLSRRGVPTSAQLAMRSGKRLTPAAYVDWAPTRVAAFVSPACHNP
jgi:hypothetical protein